MPKKMLSSYLLVFMFVGALIVADRGWTKITFLSSEFAVELCKQWNASSLINKLGSKASGGNGWVNTEGKSKQYVTVFARDCSNPKVQLLIEDTGGKAKCVYGGSLKPIENGVNWQFGPKTKEWKKWASSWSVMNMPALMSTFKGNMPVAKKNLKNFGLFWKAAAKAVSKTGSGYSCN
ncbi:MAG: hypothetical protein OEZ36_06580 [Spirochaetota bacterium]|nr:hypothetical protein [Spirochaetota bacterium]